MTGVFGTSFLNVTVNLPAPTPKANQAWDYSAPLSYMVNSHPAYYDLASNQMYSPRVSPSPFTNNSTSFSPNGQNILSAERGNFGLLQIYATAIDGSARTALTSSVGNKTSPHQSPLTGDIVFANGGDIYTMTASGGNVTNITNTVGISESLPRYNRNGTKIGCVATVNGAHDLVEMDTNGANRATLYSASFILAFDYHPSEDLMAICYVSGVNFVITLRNNEFATYDDLDVIASPLSVGAVTFSPSGQFLAAERIDGSGRTLMVYNLSNRVRQDITTLGLTAFLGDWGPLPRKKFFINPTAATLHTNAAGFMFGTAGETFASMLAFDAQTRNTVAIDPAPASSLSANYTATITAVDKLTMLRYANGMTAPRVTIIDPANVGTHAQGAIVTFKSSDGTVVSALTFTRSRSGEPASVRDGNRIRYNYDFLAAYDSTGVMVKAKPTNVELNTDTGAVSFR